MLTLRIARPSPRSNISWHISQTSVLTVFILFSDDVVKITNDSLGINWNGLLFNRSEFQILITIVVFNDLAHLESGCWRHVSTNRRKYRSFCGCFTTFSIDISTSQKPDKPIITQTNNQPKILYLRKYSFDIWQPRVISAITKCSTVD